MTFQDQASEQDAKRGNDVLEIDGAAFSGSGMIVRQAVAYAGVTGTDIHMYGVRARRPRPGLRHQHLCAVEAVRAMVGGALEGAWVGSQEFTFRPAGGAPTGRYQFDVGTAGSATALSLALLPVLATAPSPVNVELIGGLFQDRAPSAFHLQHVLAPVLGQMGFAANVVVVRPGYVPSGGGVLHLDVQGCRFLAPLDAQRPGRVVRLWGIALSSHLRAREVSGRMARRAQEVLAAAGFDAQVEQRDDTSAVQPGAVLALFADLSGGCRLGADGAGALGRSAEAVGSATARRLLEDLRTGAALDRFASDQIIMFAALAAGQTRVRLAAITEHVRTGLWLAELFGLASPRLEGLLLIVDGSGLIRGGIRDG